MIVAAAAAVFVTSEGVGGDAVGGERGAGVEAEPAEPQQAGAEDGHRDVVRLDAVAVDDAPADEQRDDRGPTRPDEAWTTVPPAKSRAPSLNSQPSAAQTQCAIGE